jgi:ATP-dependent DNA ligase
MTTSTRAEVRRIRILLLRYGGRSVVQSRRRSDLTYSFPDVAAAALEQLPEDNTRQGEAVAGVDARHGGGPG